MKNDIFPDMRNKLTAPKIALEKLAKGESVPSDYLKLAVREINAAILLLQKPKVKSKTG